MSRQPRDLARTTLTVGLLLENRPCLVVGGGAVAARKVGELVARGARVTVVAPELGASLRRRVKRGDVEWKRRRYRRSEVARYWFVVSASDDPATNARVAADAERHARPCNVVDDPARGSVHMTARVERGALTWALSSGGTAPFAVAALRRALERALDTRWTDWASAARWYRTEARTHVSSAGARRQLFDRFVHATVGDVSWPVRAPSRAEMRAWLDAGASPRTTRQPVAAAQETGTPPPPEKIGTVTLVGAGPGHADLLTVAAHRALVAADAILYDRLAARTLPPDVPSTTLLEDVGKSAGHHPIAQEEITARLVALAREGKRVVRLKGGDPFLFGRGAEEVAALRAHGIVVRVIPGVPAATGVPGLAGVALTRRGRTDRVLIVNAHPRRPAESMQPRRKPLRLDDSTAVVAYMPVASIDALASELRAGGVQMSASAVIVERGSTPRQRVFRTSVGGLAATARREALEAPALVVVAPGAGGMEAALSSDDLPLRAHRVLLFAPKESELRVLADHGAEVYASADSLSPAAFIALLADVPTDVIVRARAHLRAATALLRAAPSAERTTVWCDDPRLAASARRLLSRHASIRRLRGQGLGSLVADCAELRFSLPSLLEHR